MAVFPDDDLFTPTLTEEDDVVGFERPWNPWSLVVLSFFFGISGGGALLALNFSRLGTPRKVLPAVFAVIAVTLLITATRGWGYASLDDAGQLRLLRFADRAMETGVAGALAWMQRRRYRVFRGSSAEPGKLLLPGLLAAVLSVVIQLALSTLFESLFQR